MTELEIRLQKAVKLAVDCHSNQFRHASRDGKFGKIPYITHPMDVLKTIAYWGIKIEEHPDIHIAAILHDVVEDTGVGIDEIEGELGGGLWSKYVDELTFDPEESSKEEYMASFHKKSLESFTIKLSDRVNNVRDFSITSPDYAGKYFHKADALWDYLFGDAKDLIIEKFSEDTWILIYEDFNELRNKYG